MKSFSTMSITAEIEKEDKIRELEIVVDDQRTVIENQNLRIQELEVVVSKIENGVHQNGFTQNHTELEYEENEELETNGYHQEDENQMSYQTKYLLLDKHSNINVISWETQIKFQLDSFFDSSIKLESKRKEDIKTNKRAKANNLKYLEAQLRGWIWKQLCQLDLK